MSNPMQHPALPESAPPPPEPGHGWANKPWSVFGFVVLVIVGLLVAVPVLFWIGWSIVATVWVAVEVDGNPSLPVSEPTSYVVETPCYSFESPLDRFNQSSPVETDNCQVSMESPPDADDEFSPRGATISVVLLFPEDIPQTASGKDIQDLVSTLPASFFTGLGDSEIMNLHESIILDGSPANVVRLMGGPESRVPSAVIISYPPAALELESGSAEAVVIRLDFWSHDGEDDLTQLAETWRWEAAQ